MKALILSDLHSNIHALEAIWAQEKDSDIIYCAGDLVDYGLYPKDVLNWVRGHSVTCVQGNHDRYVAFCYRSGHTLEQVEADERAWVHHNVSQLDEADIAFLETLPRAVVFELDGIRYGMTHMYQDYEIILSLYAFEQFCCETFSPVEGGGDGSVVRLLGVPAFGATTTEVVIDAGNLRFLGEVVNAMKDFMFQRQLLRLTIREDAFEVLIKRVPLVFAPKVVDHQESAVQQIPS